MKQSTTFDDDLLSSLPKLSHEKDVVPANNLQNESIEAPTDSDKSTELIFEKETSVPDFEREPVYDVDNFEKNSVKIEKLLTPPPDFQKALQQLPQSLQGEFKHILNADIVGIWPIRSDILLNKLSED